MINELREKTFLGIHLIKVFSEYHGDDVIDYVAYYWFHFCVCYTFRIVCVAFEKSEDLVGFDAYLSKQGAN